MEILILVDRKDKKVGIASRKECHHLPGKLHRAIMVVVENEKGQILLARRSKSKRLWPGIWDGTIATHVFFGETIEEAAKRALKKELGLDNLLLTYLGHFIYRAKWDEDGVEYEYCHAFLTKTREVVLNPEEVSEVAWTSWGKLTSYSLTSWFFKALKLLKEYRRD